MIALTIAASAWVPCNAANLVFSLDEIRSCSSGVAQRTSLVIGCGESPKKCMGFDNVFFGGKDHLFELNTKTDATGKKASAKNHRST